jgi:hypothetical protein
MKEQDNRTDRNKEAKETTYFLPSKKKMTTGRGNDTGHGHGQSTGHGNGAELSKRGNTCQQRFLKNAMPLTSQTSTPFGTKRRTLLNLQSIGKHC